MYDFTIHANIINNGATGGKKEKKQILKELMGWTLSKFGEKQQPTHERSSVNSE